MVNIRFRGVELEESAKSEEARRRNPTAEAEREFLDSVGEAYVPEAAGIGSSSFPLSNMSTIFISFLV